MCMITYMGLYDSITQDYSGPLVGVSPSLALFEETSGCVGESYMATNCG